MPTGASKIRFVFLAFLLSFSLFSYSRPPLLYGEAKPSFKITEVKMCQEVDKNRNPVKVTAQFPAGTNTVYAWFVWEGAKAGFQVMARWYYASEDIHILDFPVTLTRSASHGVVILRMGPGKTLPAGSYRLDIEVQGKVVKSVPFTALPPAQS